MAKQPLTTHFALDTATVRGYTGGESVVTIYSDNQSNLLVATHKGTSARDVLNKDDSERVYLGALTGEFQQTQLDITPEQAKTATQNSLTLLAVQQLQAAKNQPTA